MSDLKSDAGGNENVIDAAPTKELFIDMLTRDIGLIPAIIDLVDNSADGAKRLAKNGSMKGHATRLTISEKEFVIADNCGGIAVDVARKYAFRFGRPMGAPSVKHSVGQFGVGMKRAIFKMGRRFRIESTTETSRFVVDVDVNEWAKKPKWEFEFAELEENGTFSKDEQGSKITVTELHQDVADLFKLGSFETDLANDLKSRLQDPIANGLAVTLNTIPVNAEPLQMLSNEHLSPARKSLVYPFPGSGNGKKSVKVELFCGLGRSATRNEEREEAGWHVFCNGRLILEGDKTEVTGWGEEEDDLEIPGFHGQFNHLRGFAYFDSDDPARLPWNTTKTGINTDSPIYRAVKLQMMMLMRPVIDFLNRLKDEKRAKEDPGEKGPLEKILEAAKPAPVDTAVPEKPFTAPPASPPPPKPAGPRMQKIRYEVPVEQLSKAMRVLRVSTYKDVGEKTFHYFYKNEVDE